MHSKSSVLLRANGERIAGLVHLQPYRGAFAGTFRATDSSARLTVDDEMALEQADGEQLLISGVMVGFDGTLFFLPRASSSDAPVR